MNSISNKLEISTDQQTLQELYSATSKIIISHHDKEIFFKTLNTNNQIQVYEFKLDTNQGIIKFLEPDSKHNFTNPVPVTLSPSFCLGLLIFSPLGKKELLQLAEWWSERNLAQSTPDLIELNQIQEMANLQRHFWHRMYVQMEKQNQATAVRIAALQRQYLELRKLHEDMQNAFASVEAYLSQAKLPPLQLAFDTAITDKLAEPKGINDSNSLILRQLLPLSSKGLAAIELHIARQYAKAVGNLKISLKACEAKMAIAVWKVPYANLALGWLALDLPKIDLGRKRDVELIIEWQTQLGPAPSLSLTQKQPILESRAYNKNITLDRSIALRIWQGLPGTRKVTSPYLVLTHQQNQLEQPQLGYLGQRSMTSVQEVTPNSPEDPFEHIQVFEAGAKIMTHPRADGTPTIAMLPYCFPATANRLIASIITDHESAGTVEYAMAIIKPEIDPQTALDHHVALGFSGWIAIKPQTHRKITLNLLRPASNNCHIVLAAKLAPNASSDFAWAHWLNFYTDLAATQKSSQTPEVNHNPQSEISTSAAVPSKIINSAQIKLRDASLPLFKSEFAKVQLIEQENKIQVHPHKDGNTIAVVTNAVQPGIIKVRSTVCTENAAASMVEYAIAIIANDDDTIARLAIASPTSALGFSGWQKVTANTPYDLELNLAAPIEETCHLVLATRLPQKSDENNAWARWLNIEFA